MKTKLTRLRLVNGNSVYLTNLPLILEVKDTNGSKLKYIYNPKICHLTVFGDYETIYVSDTNEFQK